MKTMRISGRIVPLFAALAVSCGGGSGGRSTTGPGALATGPLTVYVTDAVGNLASVMVTVSRLSLFDGSGREVPLQPPATAIDLVAAHDNPAKLGVFGIPVGSYNRVKGAIDVKGFTTTDHPNRTCRFADNPYAFDVSSDKIALVMTEAGLRITVDVPLDPKADCPADGAVGSMSLQTISVSLG
jgi:hypothetical protein